MSVARLLLPADPVLEVVRHEGVDAVAQDWLVLDHAEGVLPHEDPVFRPHVGE